MPAWPVRPAAMDGSIGEADVAPVQPPAMHDPGEGEPASVLAGLDAPADRMIPSGSAREARAISFARWLMAASLAVALHVGLLVAVTPYARDMPAEADGSPVTVDIIDMSSAPAAPPNDSTRGPEASASEAQDAAPPVVPSPPPQERPPDPAPIPSEVKPSEPTRDPAPASDAAAVLPPPTPQPETPPPPAPTVPPANASNASVDSSPPPAATPGDRDTTTHAGDHPAAGARELSRWQSALVAHIEGFRRYPKDAHGHGGTAVVGFTLDPAGHVVAVRIVTSSGSAAIDAEALATLRRADPFPAPPAGNDGRALTFTLPIRFQAR